MTEPEALYNGWPVRTELCRLYVGLSTDEGDAIAPDAVVDWLATRRQSFTVQEAQGFQEGKPEASLVITLGNEGMEWAMRLATDLCVGFRQRAVGVEFGGRYHRIGPGGEQLAWPPKYCLETGYE